MNPIEDMSKIRLVICVFLSLAFSKDVKANPMFWGPARNPYYQSRYQNVEEEIKPVRCFGLDISSPIYGYSKYGSSAHNYGFHCSKQKDIITTDSDFEFTSYCLKNHVGGSKQKDFSNHNDVRLFDFNSKIGVSYNFLKKNERHDAAFVGFGIGLDVWTFNGDKTLNYTGLWFNINTGGRITIFKNFYFGVTLNYNFGGMAYGDVKTKAFPITAKEFKEIMHKLESFCKQYNDGDIDSGRARSEVEKLGKDLDNKFYSIVLNFYLGVNIPYDKE